MSRRLAVGLLLSASALAPSLALLGCGATVRVPTGGTVRVAISDYRLNPDRIHARAGTVTVVASNFGRLAHDLVISIDGHSAASLKPLPPGGSEQQTVTLGPGTYQIASTLLSDAALGISGTLIVT